MEDSKFLAPQVIFNGGAPDLILQMSLHRFNDAGFKGAVIAGEVGDEGGQSWQWPEGFCDKCAKEYGFEADDRGPDPLHNIGKPGLRRLIQAED